jgi:ATP-binding cassette subfamily B protein
MSAATGFERLLPRRIWLQGAGLQLIAWSLLAAVSIVAMLVLFCLQVDLFVHHGQMVLSSNEVEDARSFFQFQDDESFPLENTGLMPTAWKLRDRPAGRLLAGAMKFPVLRTNRGSLLWSIFGWAAFAALWTMCRSRIRTLSSRIAAQAATHVRTDLHRQSLRVGLSGLDDKSHETVVSLFLKETATIWENVFTWSRNWWREVSTTILVLGLLLTFDWRLTLQSIVPLAAAWWMFWYERRVGAAQRRLAISRAAGAIRALSDGLRKPRLVRGYAMENFEHEQFQKHLTRLTNDVLLGQNLEGSTTWTARAGIAVLCAVVLFLVGARVLSLTNPVPIAVAATFLLAFGVLTRSVSVLRSQLDVRRSLDLAGDTISRYLQTIPEVSQAVGAKFLEPCTKSIIFENVTYTRSHKPLLDRLDLRIPARKSIAIVAFDQLAPRAITYMLPRFIEPQNGRVLIDSEDIAWGTLESIRAEMLYVGGDDPLFTGTVLENITCGDPKFNVNMATEAAKLVHAHQFIQKLPQGYDTPLGEHGEQLDPGQSFRIGLARAVLRNPAVIIVEEPENALSTEAKDSIEDAYQRLSANRTVIFLPARLSTIRRADQVVFIHDGKVEAIGPHADLIKQSELYRHWEYTTFSAFRKAAGAE